MSNLFLSKKISSPGRRFISK
jgi:hypothetical protein